ncbi:hypothetical protein EMPS_04410 [Entomortierella parvispora]|uniref:Adhesin domain-containing protein n=1 Tax=Entomortierella parvispora TaxID=205924 RepID=A0A9P3LVG4_9FUNG|nr:hypothetical protein EMPS_04410 [Entomortierella parvispora]
MDIKKIHPDSSGWDASVERDIFGNQAPYASGPSPHFSNNSNNNQAYPPQNPNSAPEDNEGTAPYLAKPYIPESALPNSNGIFNKINEHTQESLPTYREQPDSNPNVPGVIVHAPNAPLAPLAIPQPASPPQPQPTQSRNISQWALQEQPHSPQHYGAIAPVAPAESLLPGQQPQLQHQQLQHQTRSPLKQQRAKKSRRRPRSESEVNEPLLPFGTKKSIRKKSRQSLCQASVIFLDRFGWAILLVAAAMILLDRYLGPALIQKDACTIAAGGTLDEDNFQLSYTPNSTVIIRLLDGIVGDVTIIENETWDDEDLFMIDVSSRSPSKVALDLIKVNAKWSNDLVNWTMGLDPANGPLVDQQALLKSTCTRTNVTFTIPKIHSGLFKVELETRQGTARILLSKPEALLGNVRIKAIDGDIFVDSTSVKGVTEMTVQGNGTISGKLLTSGKTTMSVEEGSIDIEIDTDLDLVGSQAKNLDLVLSNKKGPINLVQTRRFDGRFSLSSGLGNVALESSSMDKIHYTADSNDHYRKGWITKNGLEPPNALPSIQATADEGPIHVVIQK